MKKTYTEVVLLSLVGEFAFSDKKELALGKRSPFFVARKGKHVDYSEKKRHKKVPSREVGWFVPHAILCYYLK